MGSSDFFFRHFILFYFLSLKCIGFVIDLPRGVSFAPNETQSLREREEAGRWGWGGWRVGGGWGVDKDSKCGCS